MSAPDLDVICPPDAAREAISSLAFSGWLIVRDERHPSALERTEALQHAICAALAWMERDAARERESQRNQAEAARQGEANQQFYRRRCEVARKVGAHPCRCHR